MNASPPRLRSLGGDPAPGTLEADLRSFVVLPDAARAVYDKLVVLNLAPEVNDQVTSQVRAIVEELGIDPQQLIPSIRACRTLMRGAARYALPVEMFVEDLMALVADEPTIVQALSAIYEKALPFLRGEIVTRTLAEHGPLATSMSWRVDHVTRSHRGDAIDTHVAVMTFGYRQAEAEKSFSIQLTAEMLQRVREACATILAKPRPE